MVVQSAQGLSIVRPVMCCALVVCRMSELRLYFHYQLATFTHSLQHFLAHPTLVARSVLLYHFHYQLVIKTFTTTLPRSPNTVCIYIYIYIYIYIIIYIYMCICTYVHEYIQYVSNNINREYNIKSKARRTVLWTLLQTRPGCLIDLV